MSGPVARQWAWHYIHNMKLKPIPLVPKSKEAFTVGWNDGRDFGVDDFREGANIGIRSVDGLVVLDDDIPRAAPECLDEFFPPTGAVYGRMGKPRSKRLFVCRDLPKTITFHDIDSRKHMVQLRVGLQDMAPPSIHPNGERLKWDGLLLPPASVRADELETAARHYWTARLIGQYWPQKTRHELRLAYARVLLEALGLSVDLATKILEWACRLGGSDDHGIRSVEPAIRDTKRTLDANEPATGTRRVSEILEPGREIVHLLRKAYNRIDPAQAVVEELNQKHAFVWQQSGSTVVLTEDEEDGHPHLRFSKPSEMSLLYPELVKVGEKTNGSPIRKPRGSVWLRHPDRRFYRGIEVAPDGCGNPGYYNLWRGFSVEPKRGEWPLFRQHLNLVSNHNEDYTKYIFAWMAETVQRPSHPIGVALAFKGIQGTGKSTFAKWFGSLFGVHFLHLDSEQHLIGRFNAHLHNAIVVLADEAVWAGSKAGLGTLKRMITEDTLNIERKNVDVLTVKNMIHMLIASNEKWVVPAGFDNRRFAIFGTSPQRKNDTTFFAAVSEELFRRDGLSALLYDLLELKTDINLHHIPETKDLQEQKGLSADFEERWWLEKLHQGVLVVQHIEDVTGYIWPKTISKEALHDDYIKFLDKHHKSGRTPRSTETELGTFLKKRTPLDDKRVMVDGQRTRHWNVPPLAECRAAWAAACGWSDEYVWD